MESLSESERAHGLAPADLRLLELVLQLRDVVLQLAEEQLRLRLAIEQLAAPKAPATRSSTRRPKGSTR